MGSRPARRAVAALPYLPDRDIDKLRHAVDVPALSPGWQASFRDLLDAAEGCRRSRRSGS
ncbi:3-alpha domain-containing protein [Nonomuraea helvata]|uniref:3-alpha domain-containing protein n=1 Tax=Nonomuraea helvata TaxID=37484 RepID=UPI003CD0841E